LEVQGSARFSVIRQRRLVIGRRAGKAKAQLLGSARMDGRRGEGVEGIVLGLYCSAVQRIGQVGGGQAGKGGEPAGCDGR